MHLRVSRVASSAIAAMAEADVASNELAIRMTIKTLVAREMPKPRIARELSFNEETFPCHLRRLAQGASNGRGRQQRRASAYRIATSPGRVQSRAGGGARRAAAGSSRTDSPS
jgi:hypothetical protein